MLRLQIWHMLMKNKDKKDQQMKKSRTARNIFEILLLECFCSCDSLVWIHPEHFLWFCNITNYARSKFKLKHNMDHPDYESDGTNHK